MAHVVHAVVPRVLQRSGSCFLLSSVISCAELMTWLMWCMLLLRMLCGGPMMFYSAQD